MEDKILDKIKDNRNNNYLDFKKYIQTCVRINYAAESALRMPAYLNYNTSTEDRERFKKEFEKYTKELEQIYKTNGSNEDWRIIDGNGDYIYPNVVRNEKFGQQFSPRFVRIYVGLNLSNIVEFFRELDTRAAEKHLNYYYKLHREMSPDRFVIYPRNEHLFKICDIICQIKKDKPYLFENALDKLLATKIAPGVSVASDNPIKNSLSFTDSIGKIVEPYLQEALNALPAPDSKMAVKLFLKNYLIDRFGNSNDYINAITEEHVSALINAMKNNKQHEYLIINGKRMQINLRFPARLCTKSESQKQKLIDGLGDFNNFKKWQEIHKKEFKFLPSENNIAFSDEQVQKLEEIYNKNQNENQ